MLTHKILIAVATTSLVCLSAPNAWAAQTMAVNSASTTTSATTVSSGVASDELVSRYTKLAGSKTNAQSLITGLRTGSLVTLVPSTTITTTTSAPTITFTPTTQKMGYGNINIALSLAKTTLAKQGITNPTPEQLAAALNGGNITLTNGTMVTMTGILTQRSSGMGWGKIAQTSGVKLGSVVSHTKTDKVDESRNFAKTEDDRKSASTTKTSKEDRKDMITTVSSTKTHSASDESGTGHSKNSNSSSGNTSASSSSGSSSSASSHSGGGGGGSSSSNGGGKSSGGGNSGGGGNGGGNSGGNGGVNGGGNGGGSKK